MVSLTKAQYKNLQISDDTKNFSTLNRTMV